MPRIDNGLIDSVREGKGEGTLGNAHQTTKPLYVQRLYVQRG